MSRLFDLTGRVALVTGGNGGIGLGMARAMHGAGASIMIAGRNTEKNAAAVADGEASRALNRIPPERCRWVGSSVEAGLARVPPCDLVIVDPPREGCSAAVRATV